jgi:hypothetical protein
MCVKKQSFAKTVTFPRNDILALISLKQNTVALKQKISDYLQKNFTLKGSYFQNTDGYYGNFCLVPAPRVFKGKVNLFVNSATFSAAEHFCRLFKLSKRGFVYGTETAGSYSSLNADIILTYTLPASQISFDVPLIKSVYADFSTNFLKPDFPIENVFCE